MITLRIDNWLNLFPFGRLPRATMEALKERLTFANPAWLENQKHGFSNWRVPKKLQFWEIHEDRLVIPRGFTGQAIWILRDVGVPYQVDIRTRRLPEVDFRFNGHLKDFQQEATPAVLRRDFGTLSAPTGSGKTVMALAVVAARRQPTLIVVHTKELLNQWVDRIEAFLDIPSIQVGVIGNGKMILGEKISVALVQTLYRCANEVAPHIGHLVVDECHRAPSRTFTEAVTAFDSKYMLGLSATPWRRDGLSRLIYWFLGRKVYEVKRENLIEDGHILEAEIIIRETAFDPISDPSKQYSQMLSELTLNPERNAMIAGDVAAEAFNGTGIGLVLTDRKVHCEILAHMMANLGIQAAVLTGDLSNSKRQVIIEALKSGKIKVMIATGQLIGEGFDCPDLSTLFLATPIRFNGRVLQYLGRVLRPTAEKDKARVYDYHDINVGVLVNAARARALAYGNLTKPKAPGNFFERADEALVYGR